LDIYYNNTARPSLLPGTEEAQPIDVLGLAFTYISNRSKMANLPVEPPIKVGLVINLKTAQALGLTLPATLLFQADEVMR
jgi:hypothetical protein